MVAYVLPSATDETAIRTGKRRALLARPRREDAGNPHAGRGAKIHLRIAANREEPARYLPTQRCVLRAEAVFTPTGVLRVTDAEPLHQGTTEGVHALLLNAEQGSAHDRTEANDKLAVVLGFTDYAALWADIGRGASAGVARVVIAWEALS